MMTSSLYNTNNIRVLITRYSSRVDGIMLAEHKLPLCSVPQISEYAFCDNLFAKKVEQSKANNDLKTPLSMKKKL